MEHCMFCGGDGNDGYGHPCGVCAGSGNVQAVA